MEEIPFLEVTASGVGSIAAEVISGTVATGDNALVDARKVELAPGAIPRPADVSTAVPISNLPRPPARVFLGRETALRQLGGALSERATAVVTQAVYGLGGVGKSELALHHAHAHRDDYPLMWWIIAGHADQVEAGLADLAMRLCPEIGLAGTTRDAAGWALAWLQAHAGWLLVLDNVEDLHDVEPLLAQLSRGHILITTRRDVDWQRLAVPVRLDVLDPGPAAEVITRRTGHATPADQDDAAEVAAELGYLPLALDQAAAFIIQARITPGSYLAQLQRHPLRMYSAAGGGEAQRTIARLWDITIEAVRERDPDAVRLLYVLVHYAPDSIPRVILGGTEPGPEVDEWLGLLASFSMITLTSDTVSIHRLVQAVILSKHAADQRETVPGSWSPRDTALDWLKQAIPVSPDTNVDGWPLLRALVGHAESLTSHYTVGDQPELLGLVHSEIGLFHQSQGDYQRALAMRESALRIIETALGPDHPDTALQLGNLAVTYSALGRLADALPLSERALRITETALGPDHPDTALRLGNLAVTYSALGRLADALPLEQRALRITETALGPDHPSMGIAMGNLASTYRALGRAADALPLAERALRITETALGPDHHCTANRLGNLAVTYSALGRLADALPLEQRALRITETALGPDHPDTALRLRNLAVTYRTLGRGAEAFLLEQRALQIIKAERG